MTRLIPFALCACFALAPLAASAQSAILPEWERLTPEQREMLIAPMRERWNASPARRARMLQHAQRWKAMTPEQRARASKGVDRFQNMSPAEREKARAAFKQFRALPSGQQREIREKLKSMTPEQRRAWLREHGVPRPPRKASL